MGILNSLRPSDTIWRHGSGSTLAQVMACCLMAPSHYLNQCWLIISKVLWLSCRGNFTRDASIINYWNLFENYMSKISFKSPRGQWVKLVRCLYIEIAQRYLSSMGAQSSNKTLHTKSYLTLVFKNTVWCRYNAVNFLPNPHNTLHWRHNDHGGISNHQPHSCLLNRLKKHQSSASLVFVRGIQWDRWTPHTKGQ